MKILPRHAATADARVIAARDLVHPGADEPDALAQFLAGVLAGELLRLLLRCFPTEL